MESAYRGQYLPPVPEDIAERLCTDLLTLRIMDALEWRRLIPDELEQAVPGSTALVPLMTDAGIIRMGCGAYLLGEVYYDRCSPMDSGELYWFLVSEKRDWGLWLEDLAESPAMRLIATKFGTSFDTMDYMDPDGIVGEDSLEKSADRLFGLLMSLVSDEDPESLFERWTREVHSD